MRQLLATIEPMGKLDVYAVEAHMHCVHMVWGVRMAGCEEIPFKTITWSTQVPMCALMVQFMRELS